MLFDGEIERGAETMLPAFARNIWRGLVRYPREGATTMRGDAIVDNLSFGDFAGQALGFAPAEYVQQLEMNAQYKKIDRAIADQRSKLMKQLYMALRERNFSEARKARAEIMEFNKKHPEYPIAPKNLQRSLKQHEETSRDMSGGVTYNPALQTKFRQLQSEWSSPTFWGR